MSTPTALDHRRHLGWHAVIRVETLAYTAIVIIALLLRGVQLGAAPLSAGEARHALAALDLLNDGMLRAGSISSPLLFGGTVISFALLGATDFAARLVPLLSGLGLVLAPLLFRRRLGPPAALITSAWLAISPIAVGASRRATGVGLAALLLLIALAALDRWFTRGDGRAAVVAGAALGAALLADAGAFVALLGVALGWAFAVFTDEERLLTPEARRAAARGFPWGSFFAALGLAVALLSTLFFAAPGGLGAAADQLARFVSGFVRPVPGAASAFVTLLIYHPGLVIFALAGAWLATQSALPWQRALAGWGIAAALLALLYQGAEPVHALWAVLPLAGLAAPVVRRLVALEDGSPAWGLGAYTLSLLALVAMILASLVRHLTAPRTLPFPPSAASAPAFNLPLDLALAVLWAMLLAVLVLSAATLWQTRFALRGAGLALLALTVLGGAGQSGALAFFRPASPFEPLNVAPSQPGIDRLVATAEEFGNLATGYRHDISITVQADRGSALAWALREFDSAEVAQWVDPTVSTALVVTPAEGAEPALGSSYVGQDFVITQAWQPSGLSAADAVRWLIYRTAPAPASEERAILWVREDIYRLEPAAE